MSQRSIIVSNFLGLIGAGMLTALSFFIVASAIIPPLVVRPIFVGMIFLFLATISIAEIPLMIFSIRQMTNSLNPNIKYALILTNIGFTFFGSVYAACFIILTGWLWLGAFMATFSLVRFISAMLFVPKQA